MLTAALLLLGLKVLGQTRVKGLDLVLVTCDSSHHGRSGVSPAWAVTRLKTWATLGGCFENWFPN